MATVLAPVSVLLLSSLLLVFLPGEVFGGVAGADEPGVLAATALAAAASAAASGCEFGSFGPLGVFAVAPAAGVAAGVLAVVLPGAAAAVALLPGRFDAESLGP